MVAGLSAHDALASTLFIGEVTGTCTQPAPLAPHCPSSVPPTPTPSMVASHVQMRRQPVPLHRGCPTTGGRSAGGPTCATSTAWQCTKSTPSSPVLEAPSWSLPLCVPPPKPASRWVLGTSMDRLCRIKDRSCSRLFNSRDRFCNSKGRLCNSKERVYNSCDRVCGGRPDCATAECDSVTAKPDCANSRGRCSALPSQHLHTALMHQSCSYHQPSMPHAMPCSAMPHAMLCHASCHASCHDLPHLKCSALAVCACYAWPLHAASPAPQARISAQQLLCT